MAGYQVMPRLTPDEYAELEQSIIDNGVQVPITVDQRGVIVDGHHRDEIARKHALHCPRVTAEGDEQKLRGLAFSLNLHRRHLNTEQRRQVIAESLKADPKLSNREHAKRTGVSDKTVGSVRDDLESTAEIPQSDERVSGDGRTRPATQPPRPVIDPRPEPPQDHRFIDADELDELNGVTPKPEPAPVPEPAAPKRRPLTDQIRDAGWELRKAIERLERLAADDRFDTHKSAMAPHLRGHLTNAIEVCQDLIDRTNSVGA